MILYSVLGEAFEIDSEAWSEVLSVARANGWRPAGTTAPPLCLDLNRDSSSATGTWHGAYTPALGQQVTRDDARSLAKALETATFRGASFYLSGLVAPHLAAFCRRGGFVLSGSVDVSQPYRPPVKAAPTTATLECVSS